MMGASSEKCVCCGEFYSVLRRSVECGCCRRTMCSVCCRPSSQDRRYMFCLSCLRQQNQKDDPDDDRPKWLRAAQQMTASTTPSSNPSIPLVSVPRNLGPAVPRKQKLDSTLVDDRPKWLRDAQETRILQQSATAAVNPASFNNNSPVTFPALSNLEARLADLKRDSNKVVDSEEELHARLRRLRDEKPTTTAAPRLDFSTITPVPCKTESEEIESLLAQMAEQSLLDKVSIDLVEELEERLRRLKAETAKLGITSAAINWEQVNAKECMEVDSDEEAERILHLLPAVPERENSSNYYNFAGEGEEDFCVMCSEAPRLICLDCENDKYCLRCFRDCHKDWVADNHRTRQITGM